MLLTIDVDKRANFIVNTLLDMGYQAYVVGGCVRDSIFNILNIAKDCKIKDWDICTSALPEVVMDIFKEKGCNIIETGLKHGTVTVMVDGEGFEVTTFRVDGNYSDGRRPDSVEFTSDIKQDLLRRDLTINALAYNDRQGLVGAYSLREHLRDIISKTIRFIGDPNERIKEDALRILRALRFSSKLGFSIEQTSKEAILNNVQLLEKVSMERIQSEFLQIINGINAYTILDEYRDVVTYLIPELLPCVGFEQRNPHHLYDVYTHTLKTIEHIKELDAANIKFALLLHDIGKPSTFSLDTTENGEVGRFFGHPQVSHDMAVGILERFKFSNKDTENILNLIKYHDNEYLSRPSVRKALQKMSKDTFEDLLILRECDIAGQSNVYKAEKLAKLKVAYDKYKEVLDQSLQLTTKQLDIDGRDLMKLGFKPGKIFSIILNELLEKVINEELTNDHGELVRYIEDNLTKYRDI